MDGRRHRSHSAGGTCPTAWPRIATKYVDQPRLARDSGGRPPGDRESQLRLRRWLELSDARVTVARQGGRGSQHDQFGGEEAGEPRGGCPPEWSRISTPCPPASNAIAPRCPPGRSRIATPKRAGRCATVASWRSPARATEDRNFAYGAVSLDGVEWWLPSGVTEDRNSVSAGMEYCAARVAVALRGDRGPQRQEGSGVVARRPEEVRVTQGGEWRSSLFGASEDRNSIDATGNGSAKSSGGRLPGRSRIATSTGPPPRSASNSSSVRIRKTRGGRPLG